MAVGLQVLSTQGLLCEARRQVLSTQGLLGQVCLQVLSTQGQLRQVGLQVICKVDRPRVIATFSFFYPAD